MENPAMKRLMPLCVAALACSTVHAAPPPSPVKPVTDEYHGTKVVDSYRWLEDWADPAVKQWSEAQNTHARSVLDKLPNVDAIRSRMGELLGGSSVRYTDLKYCGGRLFAMKDQPPKQHPFVVVLRSLDDTAGEETLFDPGTFDSTGGAAVDWFVPSPNGYQVALSVSKGGSESGDVYVYDLTTKKMTDVVPRVNGGTAGGSLAWLSDSSGFYYTRYPRETDMPRRDAVDMDFYQQVYFHTLGTPTEKDTYAMGKDFPKIAEIMLESAKSGWVVSNTQKGDGGEFMQSVRTPAGEWVPLTTFEDRVIAATFSDGKDASLILVSLKDAPRGKILRLDLKADKKPSLADARVIIPQQEGAVVACDFASGQGVVAAIGRIYVRYQTGGPSEVRVFDLGGAPVGTVPAEAISGVTAISQYKSDDVLIESESFLTPSAWHHYNAATSKTTKTRLAQTSPADYSDCEVVREMATSKDGTKVPLNIIRKKGMDMTLNNGLTSPGKAREIKAKGKGWELPAPTIVYGYGGYGVSEDPSFSPRRRIWLDQGGVFVVVNIRGGGEYGEEWHLAGNLTKKQNVFDDFYAAANLVIDRGYTNKDKLAIMGGSNGGLLMGATFTQHPDLCKAVVSSVGIYDMLRVELSSNGAFNVTEFGTVKDKDHFKAMFAYSPYHNVKDGTSYPATLFTTGANDPRVDPMQSRKMTARLQAADPKGTVLLRTSANTGHGQGSPLASRIEEYTDV
ncbi:MAG: prolyl oligopeptidase family serine peptidase, partial [Planctomycetota bacterium]